MRLLKQKYKTWGGADMRRQLENGLAGFEFKQGYKAKHYKYIVVQDDNGAYRVARITPQKEKTNGIRRKQEEQEGGAAS